MVLQLINITRPQLVIALSLFQTYEFNFTFKSGLDSNGLVLILTTNILNDIVRRTLVRRR